MRLIADLIDGKQVFSSGMTEEVERCRIALEHAAAGRNVALVSSGDPGIYGMAGLAIELAQAEGLAVPIEIIPGVTAAGAAAAALGAPLMLDFAAISLSDLLVPWETVRGRLEAVAQADLVVALYNPRSKSRVRQLEEAVAIFRAVRPGATPVGHRPLGGHGRPVAGAYRPGPGARSGRRYAQHRHRRQSHDPASWPLDGHRTGILAVTRHEEPWVLLLGGTADTAGLARRLAQCGFRVLVSRATDVPLALGDHPAIESRSGPLDVSGLAELVRQRAVRAIVDATHPYAATIRAAAVEVARQTGVDYFSFLRPGSIPLGDRSVQWASDHREAAAMAFAHGRPVLVTTGGKNLLPYAEQAQRTGMPLVARVLDRPDSLAECRRVGIPSDHVLAGRGPFSVEENRRQLQRFSIGVLVTKDSGREGGTPEKLEAARAEHCKIVVVGRPPVDSPRQFSDPDSLVQAVREQWQPPEIP